MLEKIVVQLRVVLRRVVFWFIGVFVYVLGNFGDKGRRALRRRSACALRIACIFVCMCLKRKNSFHDDVGRRRCCIEENQGGL